eukprot:3311741-Rhodomonas_salina.4
MPLATSPTLIADNGFAQPSKEGRNNEQVKERDDNNSCAEVRVEEQKRTVPIKFRFSQILNKVQPVSNSFNEV